MDFLYYSFRKTNMLASVLFLGLMLLYRLSMTQEKYKKNKIRTFRKVTDKKLLVPNLEQHAIQHT